MVQETSGTNPAEPCPDCGTESEDSLSGIFDRYCPQCDQTFRGKDRDRMPPEITKMMAEITPKKITVAQGLAESDDQNQHTKAIALALVGIWRLMCEQAQRDSE